MKQENECAVLQIFQSNKSYLHDLATAFDLKIIDATHTCSELIVQKHVNQKLQTLTLLSASVVLNAWAPEIKMVLTMRDEEEMYPGPRPLTVSPGCEDFVFQGTVDIPAHEMEKLKDIIAEKTSQLQFKKA